MNLKFHVKGLRGLFLFCIIIIMKTLKNKKSRIIILSVLAFIALAIAAYFIWGRDKAAVYDFAVAEKGDIVQEVSVTGRVNPAEDVDLAFEKAGKVAGIYAGVGDGYF